MCGKDCTLPIPKGSLLGSPPHVRERPGAFRRGRRIAGITPACAGKTSNTNYLKYGYQDHPRMCGKDLACKYSTSDRAGSPPHVRERHICSRKKITAAGITPACAGKTADNTRTPFFFKDHPRMCGKDFKRLILLSIIRGSPPHVRERRSHGYNSSGSIGITPACAGKTVMDPFIFALLRLPTFKIYLISLLNI